MSRVARVAALVLASFVAAGSVSADLDYSACRALKVIDGDTLDVECDGEEIRVRLLCIDTPEHAQAGFAPARDALAALVEGRLLRLEFEKPGRPARGKYGRLLAYIFVGDVLVNEEMIAGGWASFYTNYGRGRYADLLEAAENSGSSAPRSSAASTTERERDCCRVCTKGIACGDACIPATATCRADAKPPGCACNAD